MKPLVYQIVIGNNFSEKIQKCLDSVKNYADRHDYDYQCDTEMPPWAKNLGMHSRITSEWMRAEKLASIPYVLYVDWDIKIIGDFELHEDIITIPTIDTLLYYGSNIELAKKVLLKMGNRNKRVILPATGFRAFYNVGEITRSEMKKYFLPENNYIHLKYSTEYWNKYTELK